MGLTSRALFIGFSLWLCSCRTTGAQNGQSNLNAWANDADKEMARQSFTQAIYQCVPVVSAAVTGAKTVKLAKDSETSAVVDKFVADMIEDPDPKVEHTAALLRFYYNDKNRQLPPCGGEATEYVLTAFASKTNVIAIAFGEESKLRIVQ